MDDSEKHSVNTFPTSVFRFVLKKGGGSSLLYNWSNVVFFHYQLQIVTIRDVWIHQKMKTISARGIQGNKHGHTYVLYSLHRQAEYDE